MTASKISSQTYGGNAPEVKNPNAFNPKSTPTTINNLLLASIPINPNRAAIIAAIELNPAANANAGNAMLFFIEASSKTINCAND